MSESLKGFYAVSVAPSQIQVRWDRVDQTDFAGIKIFWWCIGDRGAENYMPLRRTIQFLIDARPGETYVVAAQAHFTASPITGMVGHYSTEWAWGIVKMPQGEQYTDLGQVTVIDTPRGPAILLDELREVCGQ